MKRTLMIVVLVLFVVTAASAQQNPKAEGPGKNAAASIATVDEIIKRYVQAVGGKAAVEKLTTRMIKGSVVTPSGSAPLEIYEKAPNKFLVIIDSPAGGLSRNGFNGTVAWSQNRQRGLREMSGPEVENFKREYDLHREVRITEHYPKMTVKSREKIGDIDAYVVDAVTSDGIPEVLYFDVDTGLLRRRDVTVQGTTIQAYFEDYREVDGVKLPFTIRRTRGEFTFTNKFDEVKHNVTIEDARFDKPATP